MERRVLGRTGEELSVLGLGGVVVDSLEQSEADRIVAEAVDRGINYFDVAPRYGNAEERLGPALAPYRDKVFLACKTAERARENAEWQLDSSLRRLQTDHFDLYQMHALEPDDVELVFRPGGAMEALVAAKEAGRVRFLGFSSHSVQAALAAMQQFHFDTVLFPINFPSWLGGVGPQVLEAARANDMGRLALKAIARGPWPKDFTRNWPKLWYQPLEDPRWMELALRFTLSQDVTATVGPGEPELFKQVLSFAERFKPLQENEYKLLRAYATSLTPLFTPC